MTDKPKNDESKTEDLPEVSDDNKPKAEGELADSMVQPVSNTRQKLLERLSSYKDNSMVIDFMGEKVYYKAPSLSSNVGNILNNPTFRDGLIIFETLHQVAEVDGEFVPYYDENGDLVRIFELDDIKQLFESGMTADALFVVNMFLTSIQTLGVEEAKKP